MEDDDVGFNKNDQIQIGNIDHQVNSMTIMRLENVLIKKIETKTLIMITLSRD